MKLNLWIWTLVVISLVSQPSVTRAQIIVSVTNDDLGSVFFNSSGNDMAETFGTGSAGGAISQITLSLDFNGASSTGVYLYTSSGGVPTSPYESLQIGTVSTGDFIGQNSFGQNLYNVELNASAVTANPLVANTDYALSVGGQGVGAGPGWYYTTSGSSSTGTGSFLGAYYVSFGNWNSAPSQMQGMEVKVTAVPEPSTSVLIIFGVIALLVLSGFRRAWPNGYPESCANRIG